MWSSEYYLYKLPFLLSSDNRLYSQAHRGELESQWRLLLFSVVDGITGSSFSLLPDSYCLPCDLCMSVCERDLEEVCFFYLAVPWLWTYITYINKVRLEGESAKSNPKPREALHLSSCHLVLLPRPWKEPAEAGRKVRDACSRLTKPDKMGSPQTWRLNEQFWFTEILCFYLCRIIWATVNLYIWYKYRCRYRYIEIYIDIDISI